MSSTTELWQKRARVSQYLGHNMSDSWIDLRGFSFSDVFVTSNRLGVVSLERGGRLVDR